MLGIRQIAAQRCGDWAVSSFELNGAADPVHLLVNLPRKLHLSRFVNNLTTTSYA